MSRKQAIVLLVLLISASNLIAKTKDKDYQEAWLPITPQDLSVKEVPNDPGAAARDKRRGRESELIRETP